MAEINKIRFEPYYHCKCYLTLIPSSLSPITHGSVPKGLESSLHLCPHDFLSPLFFPIGAAGVYSKLESGGGTDSGLGVDAAGGSASVFFEKGVHTDVTEDRTEPQAQRSTPRRHVLSADHAESVKVGAVEEEGHVGHNDLDARTAASLLPPPPLAPQMQGSGRRQEHADADMGSPHKSAIELGKGGIASSKGGVRVKGDGGGEANPQRQFKVLDLLRERNYYHLALSMMLTSVSGLYIAGEAPLWLHFRLLLFL